MARVLVAYGTKYGSTAEIATRIGLRLTSAGFDTDILYANLDIDLAKYDAIIVGSPMYAGKWLPEPALMIVVNRERIQYTPIALFSVGMIDIKHPGKLRDEHDAWIDETFIQEDVTLNIVASATFNGEYWRRNFPVWMRIIDSIVRITPEGDFRNWGEIDTWADETADTFKSILVASQSDDTEPT